MRCGIDSGMVVVLLITAVLIGLSWVSINWFVLFCLWSPNLNGLPLMRLSWQRKLLITQHICISSLYTFIVKSDENKKKFFQSYTYLFWQFLTQLASIYSKNHHNLKWKTPYHDPGALLHCCNVQQLWHKCIFKSCPKGCAAFFLDYFRHCQ